MNIKPNATVLDGCVLSLLSRNDYYGYELTKRVQESIQISVSTMYPVLRRLKKQELLSTYKRIYHGRKRLYYRITPEGANRLTRIRFAWSQFKKGIDDMLGRVNNE